MSRDHLLGWPAALLLLDPQPRVSQRTLASPRLTPQEEAQRRALDVEPKAAPKFVREYFRGSVSQILYRTVDGPPRTMAEKFDERGKKWVLCEGTDNAQLHTHPAIKPTTRPPEIPE